MFRLLKTDGSTRQITALVLTGILANTLIQINATPGNMAIFGSARSEFAARFGGVTGTFAKRFMIIMWAFCGLVAVALYQGPEALSDPDAAWGRCHDNCLVPGSSG